MLALPLRGSTPELYHGKYIASMFGSGEQGAWYDPSDLSTLYQNSAGTIPVTAVGQPVGLMLDKSKGLVLGPELVTNGDFSNGTTGWVAANGATISSENGRLKVVAEGKSGAYTSITCEVGKRYKLTFQGFPDTGTVRITVGSGFAQGNEYDSGVNASVDTAFSVIFTAARTTEVISTWSGSGGTSYYDNLSVRELPGNHATQATTASRPTLSARVNLLTKTEQFDDAAWGAARATITANNTTAPNGTLTADRITETTDSGTHRVFQPVSFQPNTTYTASVCFKKGTRRWGWVTLQTDSTPATQIAQFFNLDTGLLGSNNTGAGGTQASRVSAAMTSLDNGWYRCSLTVAFGANISSIGFAGIYIGLSNADNVNSYNGSTSDYNWIWGADLRAANDALNQPAYQRVNTATDYDTTGFKPYLSFDGVDDYLSTRSIDFTGTDKMTVFAGVRKLSDAAQGFIVGQSLNNTGFQLIAAGADASGGATSPFSNFSLMAHATSGGAFQSYVAYTTTNSFPSPFSAIISSGINLAIANRQAASMRINGVVPSRASDSLSGSLLSGNFLSIALNIGRSINGNIPFNGRLYGLIVRGAQTDDVHLTHAEKYLAYKSGVTL